MSLLHAQKSAPDMEGSSLDFALYMESGHADFGLHNELGHPFRNQNGKICHFLQIYKNIKKLITTFFGV